MKSTYFYALIAIVFGVATKSINAPLWLSTLGAFTTLAFGLLALINSLRKEYE